MIFRRGHGASDQTPHELKKDLTGSTGSNEDRCNLSLLSPYFEKYVNCDHHRFYYGKLYSRTGVGLERVEKRATASYLVDHKWHFKLTMQRDPHP